MKKILISIIMFFMASCFFQTSKKPLTPHEAVEQMGRGINMGNTLEPPREGDWNNGPAQEYFFDDYKNGGFTCVRIPVRWDLHTDTKPPYMIDEAWMKRVEQVVDWGLSRDLFVIINTHHENWIKENYGNTSYRFRFDSIWSQISLHFKNKSEKLLFEIINEPFGLSISEINELNERIIGIIRKTNPTRLIIFSGNGWTLPDNLIRAAIPKDDYLITTFHLYQPTRFTYEEKTTFWGTEAEKDTIRNEFLKVAKWSEKHRIPVLLGEFGALKSGELTSRLAFYTTYVEEAIAHGFAFTVWDDGGGMQVYQRETHDWNEIKDILIHTSARSSENRDKSL